MHLHRRSQPRSRPLRQSLLEDLFHDRDTEDTEDEKFTDYADFVQDRVLPVSQQAVACGSHFLLGGRPIRPQNENLSNLRIIHLCVLCVSVVNLIALASLPVTRA
jgi:hypothetical protein